MTIGKGEFGWLRLWLQYEENETYNIPLRIKIKNEYHYGWVNITTTPDGAMILNGYSYNPKPNEAIYAGIKM